MEINKMMIGKSINISYCKKHGAIALVRSESKGEGGLSSLLIISLERKATSSRRSSPVTLIFNPSAKNFQFYVIGRTCQKCSQ